jgi:hypothetical protein
LKNNHAPYKSFDVTKRKTQLSDAEWSESRSHNVQRLNDHEVGYCVVAIGSDKLINESSSVIGPVSLVPYDIAEERSDEQNVEEGNQDSNYF